MQKKDDVKAVDTAKTAKAAKAAKERAENEEKRRTDWNAGSRKKHHWCHSGENDGKGFY